MKKPKLGLKLLATTAVVVAAAVAAVALYQRYVEHAWTRDGQVQADIVLLTPRISGHVTRVNVTDNQAVKANELLFEIDPRPYRIQLEVSRVQLDEAREQVRALAAAVTVAEAGVRSAKAGIASAKAQLEAAGAQVQAAKALVDAARAGVESAQAKTAQSVASLEQDKRDRDRAAALAKDGAGSVSRAESTQAAVEATTAGVTAAKAGELAAKADLDQAGAGLLQARADLVVSEAGVGEAEAQHASALANLEQVQATLGVPGELNVRIRQAKANLAQAELNLGWTSVQAPADGYVTNLVVKPGDYATAGKAMLAFVDRTSFYVLGFFRETELEHIRPGDRAVVTLMAHTDEPIVGEVESIGLAISPPNIANTGRDGDSGIVPQVQPSFDWIRLAQRVPVRVKLGQIPAGLQLIAGTTASVAIRPEE